jgi:hypothetical protein
MKLEDYCKLREVSVEDAASLGAEEELSRTMLTLSRLREAVLCTQLQIGLPTTGEDVRRMDARQEEIMDKARQNTADESESVVASEHGDKENPPDEDHAEAKPDEEDANKAEESEMQKGLINPAKMEMRSAYEVITRFICELHKVLLTFNIGSLDHQVELLRSNCAPESTDAGHDQSGNLNQTRGHFAATASSFNKTEGNLGLKDNVRLQAVAAFNRIRLRGTRVRTHGKPVSDHSLEAYVIREHDLEECIEELGHRVLQWARSAVDSQRLRACNDVTEKTVALKRIEQHVLQRRWCALVRDWTFEAQVTAAVADRGAPQLFEVDRLHRVLNELAAAGYEMEYRLNAEIRHTVLGEIGLLEKQLVEAQNRNSKYLGDMRGSVQTEVSQLRQNVLHQLTHMSKANYVLRQKLESLQEDSQDANDLKSAARQSQHHSTDAAAVLGDIQRGKGVLQTLKGGSSSIVSESGKQLPQVDIEVLHDEIRDLRKAHTRLQTYHQMKFQSLRQSYEQKIQAFTTTLSSNSDLWERASEVKERENIAEEELNRSQRRVAAAADSVERISVEASKEAQMAAKLEDWRIHAFEWLGHLQREEKKYQREGGDIDVKKVGHQIKKFDTEIQQLGLGDRTQHRVSLEKTKSAHKIKTLQRRLKMEDNVTNKALAKTALIQREMECGELVDDSSLVGLHCDEFRSLSARLAELDYRNQVLRERARARAAGIQEVMPSKTIKDAEMKDFEESMCYAVGFMKCPQAPWYRKQIDMVHGPGGGHTGARPSSGRSPVPRASDAAPTRAQRAQGHSSIMASIRNDMLSSAGKDKKSVLHHTVLSPPKHGQEFEETEKKVAEESGDGPVSSVPGKPPSRRASLELPDVHKKRGSAAFSQSSSLPAGPAVHSARDRQHQQVHSAREPIRPSLIKHSRTVGA